MKPDLTRFKRSLSFSSSSPPNFSDHGSKSSASSPRRPKISFDRLSGKSTQLPPSQTLSGESAHWNDQQHALVQSRNGMKRTRTTKLNNVIGQGRSRSLS